MSRALQQKLFLDLVVRYELACVRLAKTLFCSFLIGTLDFSRGGASSDSPPSAANL